MSQEIHSRIILGKECYSNVRFMIKLCLKPILSYILIKILSLLLLLLATQNQLYQIY